MEPNLRMISTNAVQNLQDVPIHFQSFNRRACIQSSLKYHLSLPDAFQILLHIANPPDQQHC